MRHRKTQDGSGQQLLADFQTVFVSTATTEAAKYEAVRSENALLDHLAATGGGSYLNPGDLSSDAQADLTRTSLDTHIKKVQAQQLDSMNVRQLQDLQKAARGTYIGCKVGVTTLQPKSNAIESVWFDQRNGFYSSVARRRKVTGIVQDVLLDRNVLIIKPPFSARLLNSSLVSYMVYIINPDNLMPMVDLALI